MKVSRRERAALVLLDVHGLMRGFEIAPSSFGLLGRGSVYVHLAGLVERGWVEHRRSWPIGVPGGELRSVAPAVHTYELTPKGRLELALLREQWGRP